MANGTVRVYAGLLDAMTDDEVRFVIGHEVGHVKLGHSKKAMQVAFTPPGVRGLAAASGNQAVAQLSASAIGGFAEALVNAQFSQSQENEADTYSVGFMKRHNYPPAAAVSALRKLQALGDGASILSRTWPPANAPLVKAKSPSCKPDTGQMRALRPLLPGRAAFTHQVARLALQKRGDIVHQLLRQPSAARSARRRAG